MAVRRNKKMTGWLVILGAVVLGAFQAQKVKDLIGKVVPSVK